MGTDFRESDFQETFEKVLDYYNIGYESEKAIPSPHTDGSGRKMDIYIPKTDTALELKSSKGSLERGVGQALNYSRSCKEAILILDGEADDHYRADIHKTCQIVPAVHFALVIPNNNVSRGSGAGFDIRTDSRPDFFFEMAYNAEWDDSAAVLKQLQPGYLDPNQTRHMHPTGQQTINTYTHDADDDNL